MIDLENLKCRAVRIAAIHEHPSLNEKRLMECVAEVMANEIEDATDKHNEEMEKLRTDWDADVQRLLTRIEALKYEHSARAQTTLSEVSKGVAGSSVQALSSLAAIEAIITPLLITPDSDWFDIATCPKDGSYFDAKRNGIRYTDCRWSDPHNGVVKSLGYPARTVVFGEQPTHWQPRPDGLLYPYDTNQFGEKYVP